MGMVQVFVIALRAVISLMEVILVIRVFFEFRFISRDSKLFRFLIHVTEPLLAPVRKILASQSKDKNMKLDLSPLVVIILLYLINAVLKRYII